MLSPEFTTRIRSKSNLAMAEQKQTMGSMHNLPKKQSLSSLHPKQGLHRMSTGMRLTVSNLQQRYKLKYGADFKQLLDARDQVLQHQFEFNLSFTESQMMETEFVNTSLYMRVKDKIRQFLAEAVSNVVSVGFKFLCKRELEEPQAMEFAAKNILLNAHAVFRQTVRAIEDHSSLGSKVDVGQLKDRLVVEMDSILNNILVNLADSYPQAPVAGGNPRVREAISAVNRADDVQNDFIFNSGIKISEYLNIGTDRDCLGDVVEHIKLGESGDYTAFIMRVINAAIQVTQDTQDDSRDRTIYEKFTQFNEHLFWVCQQKDYQKMLSTVEHPENLSQTRHKDHNNGHNGHLKRLICQKFNHILSCKRNKEDEQVSHPELEDLWQGSEEGISDMKGGKQYAIGQKIPSSVPIFNRQEVASRNFVAKHSSVLRILSKWSYYLEEIFKNPEIAIKKRLYSFSNIHNELVGLQQAGYKAEEGQQKLIARLKQEYREVKRKFRDILQVSYGFIGKFLSQRSEDSVASFVARFGETRTVSSKVKAVLTSLMVNYTNLLIHHLLKAGQKIYTDRFQYHNINLVIFRLGDLMRSKLQCSEGSFITLLRTMYLLDNSQNLRNSFKLVRIKNKLDSPANNIIVNYLFMGRVQCQLQLSIQQISGKEKHYYAFSHFLYELTRGKYGPLAECATIVSQLDPMVTACPHPHYQQKVANISLDLDNYGMINTRQRKIQIQEGKKFRENLQEKLFECWNCRKLITNEETSRFASEEHINTCYQCIVQKYPPQNYLRTDLKKALAPLGDHQLQKYYPLDSITSTHYLLKVTSNGQLLLHMVIPFEKEGKVFLLKLDSALIQEVKKPGFESGVFDYVDISQQIKKGVTKNQTPKMLMYLFEEVVQIPPNVMEMVGIRFEQLTILPTILKEFISFREEKAVVKSIKYKAQIIKAGKNQWPVIDKVCQALVAVDGRKSSQIHLKYNKYKCLDMSALKELKASQVGLTVLPKWLRQCHNLSQLYLQKNQITKVDSHSLPESLTNLNLSDNALTDVNVSALRNLVYLNLGNNQLRQFSLENSLSFLVSLDLNSNQLDHLQMGKNNSLKALSIFYNPFLLIIDYLPPSLQTLAADKHTIHQEDFKDLKHMKKLIVFGDIQIPRNELLNLPPEVQYEFYPQTLKEGGLGGRAHRTISRRQSQKERDDLDSYLSDLRSVIDCSEEELDEMKRSFIQGQPTLPK